MVPSLVTYNTAISACAKAGMWVEARGLADAMAAANIAPDDFTLCALVRRVLLGHRLHVLSGYLIDTFFRVCFKCVPGL